MMSNKVEATFHGGNTDPRVTLAKHRIYGFTGADVKCVCGWGWASVLDYPAHQAEALAEADRAAGIVRVRVDDDTVERVAEIIESKHPSLSLPHPRTLARTVIAALRGES
jgi:predicted HicB family RNase H-like nuclease